VLCTRRITAVLSILRAAETDPTQPKQCDPC
jgi:hypothetical protein